MRQCQFCGGNNSTTGKYCNTCYAYLKKHPKGTYELPKDGTIGYAPNGDLICHICGQAYRKLGSHIAHKHKMTQNEYRDKFKLYHNTRLSNTEYINTMSKLNNNNAELVVKRNLIEKGKNTRTSDTNALRGRKFQYKVEELYLK